MARKSPSLPLEEAAEPMQGAADGSVVLLEDKTESEAVLPSEMTVLGSMTVKSEPASPATEAGDKPEPTAKVDSSPAAKAEDKVQAKGLITQAMIEEEQRLHEKTVKMEEDLKKEGEKYNKEDLVNKSLREERYNRLQYLLSRSNIFTSYLKNRMQEQLKREKEKREEMIKKQQEKARKQQEKENLGVKDNKCVQQAETTLVSPRRTLRNSNNNSPAVSSQSSTKSTPGEQKKRGRKRKAELSPAVDQLKLADYFTIAEERNKRQKLEQDSKEAEERHKPEVKQEPVDPAKEVTVKMINGEPAPIDQPNLFEGGILRPYQTEGCNWLKVLYENGINGILADEMGLGKTIQCIACISHLVEFGVPGPFLICAPLSTVPNWVTEFERFAPKIPVILYHGDKNERNELRKKIRKQHNVIRDIYVQPVVITSYEIAMNDRAHIATFDWKYIIVDEGHRIKNFQCRLVKELKMYRSTHRLLLTGTPLQNNLSELWSLLNFLLPEIFNDLTSFESWFDMDYLESEAGHEKLVAEEQRNNALSMLHQILEPFMLRRLKCDVELLVPPKREVLVYAPLTAKQRKYYESAVNKTIFELIETKQEKFNKKVIKYDDKGRPVRESAGSVRYDLMLDDALDDKDTSDDIEAWASAICNSATSPKQKETETVDTSKLLNIKVRNILMLLRKSCNHAYLLEYPLTKSGEFKIDEELVHSSGKFLLLDRMLAELHKRGHKVLIFSQMTSMLDLLHDYCYLRKYKFARLDGSMKVDERKEQMDLFNKEEDVFIFLLSTRAGGLGINLTAADTVIIYDSDWNPQADLQAQDRCHRIGQTRPVMIYRLVTANTIDHRIVERASNKRTLEKMVIHKGKFKTGLHRMGGESKHSPINPEELLQLLKSSHFDEVVKGRENEVISGRDLNNLLDRSDLYRFWENLKAGKEAGAITDKKSQGDVEGVFKVLRTEVKFGTKAN